VSLTMHRPRTTSPPGHWEAAGRLALAVVALVLGTALSANLTGPYGAVAAVQVLAAVGLAVAYPERARRLHPRLPAAALAVASGVVGLVLLSSLLWGSALTVLLYAAVLAGLCLVASPLLHVGPRRLR
jgi:hypothetical protein